jgi:DNA-binding GntR family transcriptional regulator
MPETLAESISQAIRNDIIEGRLNHQTFLTEGGLAGRFSTSKAPVRDALHRLCQEGYLLSYPRKGYMVNILTQDEINQIQHVRAHLEQMSIKLVIKKASDAEIDSLTETIAVPGQERNPFKTNNTRFHLRLAEISGNHYLYDLLVSMLGASSRAVILRITDAPDSTTHRRIIEALKKRDEEAALKALEDDIQFPYNDF